MNKHEIYQSILKWCGQMVLLCCVCLTLCSSASATLLSWLSFSLCCPILAMRASVSVFLSCNSTSCMANLAFKSSTWHTHKHTQTLCYVTLHCLRYFSLLYTKLRYAMLCYFTIHYVTFLYVTLRHLTLRDW